MSFFSAKILILVYFTAIYSSLLYFSDLTLTSADGNIGDTNISIQCSIFNFTRWDKLVITHGNTSLASLDFNGNVLSDLNRNISIIQNIKYLHTTLTVKFNMLECNDGGEYTCSVDGRYTKRSSVIVKCEYK